MGRGWRVLRGVIQLFARRDVDGAQAVVEAVTDGGIGAAIVVAFAEIDHVMGLVDDVAPEVEIGGVVFVVQANHPVKTNSVFVGAEDVGNKNCLKRDVVVASVEGEQRPQTGLFKGGQAAEEKAVDAVGEKGFQLELDGGLVAFLQVAAANDAASTVFSGCHCGQVNLEGLWARIPHRFYLKDPQLLRPKAGT